MADIFRDINEGLLEIFPDIGDMPMTTETRLGDIPDWDSMSAVNFQGFLEQRFGISVPQELLSEEVSIKDVISFVTEPAAMEKTT